MQERKNEILTDTLVKIFLSTKKRSLARTSQGGMGQQTGKSQEQSEESTSQQRNGSLPVYVTSDWERKAVCAFIVVVHMGIPRMARVVRVVEAGLVGKYILKLL